MATLYLPTEEDRAALQEMLAEWRARVRGSTRRPAVPSEEGSAAEVFVARVPYGGIAGMDENTTGTETASETVSSYLQDDVLSYADCDVYRKTVSNGVSTLVPTGLTKRVYNLSANAIEGQQWILITKDKWGDWYATSPINASDVSSGSSGASAGVAFVRITSSTPGGATPSGSFFPGILQNYSVAAGYTDTAATANVWVEFPNGETPGLARMSAVDSGDTSGGTPVYKALERPLTVAATDAGTGDANATYYGISTLNVNQGTGLALTNSSLSCKVAAQSASATHSGVVDLNAGQVLGSGGKVFQSYVYVNMSQQAAVGSVAFDVGGNINTSILNCYVTAGSSQTAGLVRINTSSPTTGAILIINGTTFNAPISTPVASIRVQGQVRADERYRVGADVPGFTGLYQDGLHTRMVIQGGIITGVF